MSLLGLYEQLWHPAARVLSDVVARGIQVDPVACEADSARLQALRDPLEEAVNDWAGTEVNWGSPKQVSEFLYDLCGFPVPPVQGTLKAVKLVREGERPTSEAALLHLADHANCEADRDGLRALLGYRKLTKEAQFARDIPRYIGPDGRIHPGLASTTATGRLSCKLPNLQQIPASGDLLRAALGLPDPQIRRAFVARPEHVLLVLDFSALEWRVLAHFLSEAGDHSLTEETKAGVDPHAATAVLMQLCPDGNVKANYPRERNVGKLLNYSTIYKKSAAGLGVQLRNEAGHYIGTAAAQEYLDAFYRARPGVAAWQEQTIQGWRDSAHVLTLLGRKRWIPTEHWSNHRKAANTPIQGSAHDIMTAALFSAAQLEVPVLQVHDELVFEVRESEAERLKERLTARMEQAIHGWTTFRCPLKVEGGIGDNWQDAK